MRKTRLYDAKALLSKEGKEQNSRQRAQHCKLTKFKELEQDGASQSTKNQGSVEQVAPPWSMGSAWLSLRATGPNYSDAPNHSRAL